jgi:outer membrane lipoprotein SlyB
MNTATDNLQPGQQSTSNAKPLWAAVGILGVAVLGMGGTMIYQGRTPAPLAQVAAVAPELNKPLGAASAARTSAGGANAADDMIEKPSAAPAKPAPVPAKKVVKPTPQPTPSRAPNVAGTAPAQAPMPAPVAAVAAPICGNCGAVESVTPIERTTKADGPGVGAVGGGVLGAVLGNQVGNGNGRTVATILGAIGGGFAGNAIEKKMKKETVYQVGIRMDDGSRRTIEVAQQPAVGSKVTVEGNSMRSNDGGVYRAPTPVVQRTNQPAPVFQAP